MFKNFHGFGMFEQYQAWKRERRERKSFKYRLSVTTVKLIFISASVYVNLVFVHRVLSLSISRSRVFKRLPRMEAQERLAA